MESPGPLSPCGLLCNQATNSNTERARAPLHIARRRHSISPTLPDDFCGLACLIQGRQNQACPSILHSAMSPYSKGTCTDIVSTLALNGGNNTAEASMLISHTDTPELVGENCMEGVRWLFIDCPVRHVNTSCSRGLGQALRHSGRYSGMQLAFIRHGRKRVMRGANCLHIKEVYL